MTEFQKFPSIESFSHVWASQARKTFPEATVYGTKIKLHGTNGGVRIQIDPHGVVAQSRKRDIFVGDDNAGFAAWVEAHKESFSIRREIMEGTPEAETIEHLTIFGEWAGRGIQKNDAVTRLDGKFFFVFAIQINDRMYSDPEIIEQIVPDLDELIVLPWFSPPIYRIDWVSGSDANDFADALEAHVNEIGERDPFIYDIFGVEGPGEGLVAMPATGWVGMDRDEFSSLLFKAKAEAHRVKSTERAVSRRMELPTEATEFVDMFVTDARCQQALEEACDGIAEKPRTAEFLKWLGGDVKKESEVELSEMGLEWKQVAGLINKAAVRWFMTECNRIV
ncbi:RNA ligase [Ruegeria phage RpAliso]|nr:RNA ligase [Ruegeria phage RpAliso]